MRDSYLYTPTNKLRTINLHQILTWKKHYETAMITIGTFGGEDSMLRCYLIVVIDFSVPSLITATTILHSVNYKSFGLSRNNSVYRRTPPFIVEYLRCNLHAPVSQFVLGPPAFTATSLLRPPFTSLKASW